MANRIKNFILAISLFVIILLLWQILSSYRIIPPWIASSPRETLFAFGRLTAEGVLPKLLLISLGNVIPPFLMSIIVSFIFGVLIGINSTAQKILAPFLSAIYLIPSLAWLPLFVLIFGFTIQTIWAIIFISSFIRIIYSVIGGVRGVNPNWILIAQNLELSKFDTIRKVVLPGALPQILSGIRVGFGSAWRSLVGAEMLVVTAGGLGKYIWMSQWSFKFEQVFAGMIVIALVGIIAEQLIFKRLEQKTLLKWGMMQ